MLSHSSPSPPRSIATDRHLALPLFIVSRPQATPLARYLDQDLTVHMMPLPDESHGLRTVEGMAARLVQIIRSVQPIGPYRIIGYLMGALTAYEIATQLIGADERIGFLGLIGNGENAACGLSSQEVLRRGRDGPATRSDSQRQLELPHLLSERSTEIYSAAARHYSVSSIPTPIHIFFADALREPAVLDPQGWAQIRSLNRVLTTSISGGVQEIGRALSETVRKIPAEVPASPELSYSSLTTLQCGRSVLAPLVCIPGAGDSVGRFVELLSDLDSIRPVYGFEPRGLDGTMVPHSTVQAAARFYMDALAKRCGRGSIHLLGHSFGGWVAFEMARILEEAEWEIGSVTIIDSSSPDEEGALPREYNRIDALLQWIDAFELILQRSLGMQKEQLEELSEVAQMEALRDRLVRFNLIPRSAPAALLNGPFRTFAMSLRAYYQPAKIYVRPVQLAIAGDQRSDEATNQRKQRLTTRGWSKWAPNSQFQRVSGNHVTILKRPHVSALARLLRSQLAE